MIAGGTGPVYVIIILKYNILNLYYPTSNGHILQKNATKTDIYLGSYRIRIFVFWTLLRIFVPRLEIHFFSNHYLYYVYLSTVQVRGLIMG